MSRRAPSSVCGLPVSPFSPDSQLPRRLLPRVTGLQSPVRAAAVLLAWGRRVGEPAAQSPAAPGEGLPAVPAVPGRARVPQVSRILPPSCQVFLARILLVVPPPLPSLFSQLPPPLSFFHFHPQPGGVLAVLAQGLGAFLQWQLLQVSRGAGGRAYPPPAAWGLPESRRLPQDRSSAHLGRGA